MDIAFGTKIINRKTNEIGLLIKTWLNEYADGKVWRLGFLPRSQSFASRTLCLLAQSVRYPGFTRTEIRFATCVDKNGKRYLIELDEIVPIEDNDE
ncbi:TPA: hypothetical protein IAC10_03755 [Candidatus Scatousia excrementigallinarum]|uniref:Uncharacterized protein n=1 Tax=Candidatus Scatousia excrementigallinarum TaxID=2840935 RepID=A0A9D1EY99_9BACT|nr:hypothetical protein [Candidatus Scatousia excrementigallinarum]